MIIDTPSIIDLTTVKDEDLHKEIERRKRIFEEKYLAEKRAEMALYMVNLDLYLSLVKHSRTSCSDSNTINAYTSEQGYPRCARCFLIEVKAVDYWFDEDVKLNLLIELTPWK